MAIKKIKFMLFLTCLMGFAASQTYAANVAIGAIPTSWRLQNYTGDNVVAWFTGSQCTNGQLTFGANATLNDKNRFWSMIMAAKVAGKPVVVYYEDSNAPTLCQITSFLLKEE